MEEDIKFIDVLKNKDFSFLSLGQIFAEFAKRINQTVAFTFISLVIPGSIKDVFKILLAINIPIIFISPLAGVFIDRWNKKKIMIISNIFQSFLIISILIFSINTGSLRSLYIIIFLVYCSNIFFNISRISSIAFIVPSKNLLVANSLASGINMISLISGIVLGEILSTRIGISKTFYIDCLFYFIAIIMIFSITPNILVEKTSKKLPALNLKQVFRDLTNSLIFILDNKFVWYAVTSIIILMLAGGILYIPFFIFININLLTLGLIYASIAIGLVAGTLIIGQIGQKTKKEKIILKSLISLCIIILFFSMLIPLKPNLPLELFFSLLIFISLCLGITAGPVFVAVNTILHEQVPLNMLGKIFSIQTAIAGFTFIFSLGFIILITSSSNPINFIFVLMGLSILLMSLSLWNYYNLIRTK